MRRDPELGAGLKEYLKYFAFFVVLAAALFGGVYALKYALRTEYPIMVVVSESMVPTLGVGDFILVDHIDDFDDIVAVPPPEGDILVFLRYEASDEYIVHRAIDKFSRNGVWMFVTKGDNNSVQDAQPVREGNIMGRVIYRIPIFGYFPLFIKTSRGFALVGGLMLLIFFADYIMPDKREDKASGRFPWLTLLPFLLSSLVYPLFWVLPGFHVNLEFVALASWYLGCIVAPLAFEDDDMGLMFWLYHFVLIMIPLACDLVWWTTGITPSNWWYEAGSTVPITWLLQKETVMFYRAFNQLALFLIPGCILFLVLMAAKRRGSRTLVDMNRRFRSSAV
jgi:signal peptidase I